MTKVFLLEDDRILGRRIKRFLEKNGRLFHTIALVDSGNYKFQPIDVRDVSYAFVNSLRNRKTDKKILEICGKDIKTFKEIVEDVFNFLKIKVLFIPVPKKFMYFASFFIEKILYPPPITKDQLLMMWKDNICLDNCFEKFFNKKPISYKDSIFWALSGYKSLV